VEAVHHGAFKEAKGKKLEALKVTVEDMVVGGRYYFPHDITYEDSGKTVEWLFLLECVHANGSIRRVWYADGSMYAGSPKDKCSWEDLDASKEEKVAYKISEPEVKRAEKKGSVEEFVAEHTTV
jgi:hypothetical protein